MGGVLDYVQMVVYGILFIMLFIMWCVVFIILYQVVLIGDIVGFDLGNVQVVVQCEVGIYLVFVIGQIVGGFVVIDQVNIVFVGIGGQCFDVEIWIVFGKGEGFFVIELVVILVEILVFDQYVGEVVFGGKIDYFVCVFIGGFVDWI